ncbi:MgtC/SapB family protein [uncultured Neptuniibacter sp.]|uniref:MgtC/SapB family protein n=1 Tax=uncultured Neptuniibacter sp. TaxID=502143 RepID=UPI002632681A|nr:MgtC/SapB family protein [uncultured Neptuniibacter sp.]
MDSSLFTFENNLFWHLVIALMIGMIIGIQRGWSQRHSAEGSRVAGIRTFSLVGFFGGLTAALAQHLTPWLIGFGMLALIIIMAVAFIRSQRSNHDVSITGIIGLLITYVLGCLAVIGDPVIAVSAAVITALILDSKPELHGALQRLREYELDAGLRLLLISVVLLPLLPDEGYGPWNAINPYEIWWMVVLIASISFLGYFAIRIGGARRGILFTSIFAGLSSSTALTLQFSHLSKNSPALSHLLASGILVSCGTMFPRIILVLMVLNQPLAMMLWPVMLLMMAGFYLPALWFWRQHQDGAPHNIEKNHNPLALSSAFVFGFLLMIIMLLSQALSNWFGDTGTLVLSALSGLSDVDPITLTLGRQSPEYLSLNTAALGIVIAASVNSLVKMSMTIFIGHKNLSRKVAFPMLGSVIAGALLMTFGSPLL